MLRVTSAIDATPTVDAHAEESIVIGKVDFLNKFLWCEIAIFNIIFVVNYLPVNKCAAMACPCWSIRTDRWVSANVFILSFKCALQILFNFF